MPSREEREVAERNLHRGSHSEIGLAEVSESAEYREFMTNAELLKSVKEFGERMDAITAVLARFNAEVNSYLDSIVEPDGGASLLRSASDAFDRAFNGKPDFTGLKSRRDN
jgi:hypothetical protein